jgi:hypothetical protein
MTDVMNIIFITRNDTRTNEFGQRFTPKMTETVMPKGGGCGKECRAGGWCRERVDVTRTIAPGDHVPSSQILHRKTKRIKLDGTIIVGGKTTNRNQVLNDVGDTKTLLRTRL